MLSAFAAQVAGAAERERLQGEAGKAAGLAAANTLRGSLLQAVSHDLRTPLAWIKASISSLRQRDIDWSPEDVDEFQRTIEEETDRLTELVGNLLDMSRLQASALTVELRPTDVEATVLAAVASLGPVGAVVEIDVPSGYRPDDPTVGDDTTAAALAVLSPLVEEHLRLEQRCDG